MFDFLKRLTRRPAVPATDQPAGILRTDPASRVAQIDHHLTQVRSPEMRNWLLDERLRWEPAPADVPGGEGGSRVTAPYPPEVRRDPR
jgi:hypothetical protein